MALGQQLHNVRQVWAELLPMQSILTCIPSIREDGVQLVRNYGADPNSRGQRFQHCACPMSLLDDMSVVRPPSKDDQHSVCLNGPFTLDPGILDSLLISESCLPIATFQGILHNGKHPLASDLSQRIIADQTMFGKLVNLQQPKTTSRNTC